MLRHTNAEQNEPFNFKLQTNDTHHPASCQKYHRSAWSSRLTDPMVPAYDGELRGCAELA